jgi:hypothetical protein
VAGSPARETLSAGQGKLLATAFRLAAMAVFEQVRGRIPAVVFDDVDAELDGTVLQRVFARLKGAGQALLSSAHEEMVLPGCLTRRLADATASSSFPQGKGRALKARLLREYQAPEGADAVRKRRHHIGERTTFRLTTWCTKSSTTQSTRRSPDTRTRSA